MAQWGPSWYGISHGPSDPLTSPLPPHQPRPAGWGRANRNPQLLTPWESSLELVLVLPESHCWQSCYRLHPRSLTSQPQSHYRVTNKLQGKLQVLLKSGFFVFVFWRKVFWAEFTMGPHWLRALPPLKHSSTESPSEAVCSSQRSFSRVRVGVDSGPFSA